MWALVKHAPSMSSRTTCSLDGAFTILADQGLSLNTYP
jgi:hypothetical protein